jgi:hypothetical protein
MLHRVYSHINKRKKKQKEKQLLQQQKCKRYLGQYTEEEIKELKMQN